VPPYRSRGVFALLWWGLARLWCVIGLADWVCDVSIVTFHDVAVASRGGRFEF